MTKGNLQLGTKYAITKNAPSHNFVIMFQSVWLLAHLFGGIGKEHELGIV